MNHQYNESIHRFIYYEPEKFNKEEAAYHVSQEKISNSKAWMSKKYEWTLKEKEKRNLSADR